MYIQQSFSFGQRRHIMTMYPSLLLLLVYTLNFDSYNLGKLPLDPQPTVIRNQNYEQDDPLRILLLLETHI